MIQEDIHAPPQRIHRPPFRQLLIVMSVTGFVLILCPSALVLLLSENSLYSVFVIALFVVQLMAYFLLVSSRIRVVTSAEGIEYHQLGFRIKSAWEDVEAIRTVNMGLGEREGLMLSNPSVEVGWWHRMFMRGSPSQRDLRKHFIPFTPLMRHWRHNALGRDIQQYAPHLFTAEHLEKKQHEGKHQEAIGTELNHAETTK